MSVKYELGTVLHPIGGEKDKIKAFAKAQGFSYSAFTRHLQLRALIDPAWLKVSIEREKTGIESNKGEK